MKISISGKHLDVGDALREHVNAQINETVTRYFDQAIDGHVTVSREGPMVHVDISVHPGPRGLIVQGRGEAADPYVAFETALERIRKQLRRYKRRLVDFHRRRSTTLEDMLTAQQYVLQSESDNDEVPEEANPVIVAEMLTDIATLTVSEAVMRMDLGDLPVMMFRNAQSGVLNVVYHRKDGNVGWIDPVSAGPVK